jgi:hypothetical protein
LILNCNTFFEKILKKFSKLSKNPLKSRVFENNFPNYPLISDLSETNNKLLLGNGIKSLELPLIPGYIVFDQRLADNTVYRIAFDLTSKTILLQYINTDGTLTNLVTWQGV